AEAIEELVALLAEGAANGFRLGQGVLGREERERGALHRAGAAAVEEGARAGEGLDDAARPDGPGDAPARVAPVLGEAVEEHDRIALDVLDELGRARDGRSVSIQIVGIKLVEQERAVELPRGAHPGLELRADDGLAGGIAGVREQQRAEAAPGDLAPELGEGKVVAALGVEQDRDGREAPEDLEELLVRGVVRQKVAEVDLADGRAGAHDRDAAAAAHGDVLGAVFRGKPARGSSSAVKSGRRGPRGIWPRAARARMIETRPPPHTPTFAAPYVEGSPRR